MDKIAIIITSIFKPTKAIEKYSYKKGFQLYVVGDKKTPTNWEFNNVKYLSVEDQGQFKFYLNKLLPYNHYCRKMIGYLRAISDGFNIIIDTDDDNIPYDDWNFPAFDGSFLTTPPDLGYQNVYKSFTTQEIWPRGLPLNKILNIESNKPLHQQSNIKSVKVGVWQGMADGDPDVDAIYRLTSNVECFFDKNDPIVFDTNTISPFNSQNTAFRKECFALLYLPAFVTFRFTDILRGMVAQPILWKAGYNLGFTNATVLQERNPHNYLNDFESEIPCYLNVENVVNITDNATKIYNSIPDNLYNAYSSLEMAKIVQAREVKLLELWLKDLSKINEFN